MPTDPAATGFAPAFLADHGSNLPTLTRSLWLASLSRRERGILSAPHCSLSPCGRGSG